MTRPHPNSSRGSKTDIKVVFILGGPGSGKGTQSEKIVQRYGGWAHISTGDVLREEVEKGSDIGKQCEKIMEEGKLIPTDLVIQLLRGAIEASASTRVLLDGFPRALEQGKAFESQVQRAEFAVYFELPESVMKARLLKRGESSGRADDNQQTILKRFHTFQAESMPVVEYLKDQGRLHTVPASGSPDEVFQQVAKVFDEWEETQAEAEDGAEELIAA